MYAMQNSECRMLNIGVSWPVWVKKNAEIRSYHDGLGWGEGTGGQAAESGEESDNRKKIEFLGEKCFE